MTIFEQLQLMLRKYRDDGATNKEIGDRVGLSHSHINRLLNGNPERIASLSFGTVVKLFPSIVHTDEKGAQIIQINSHVGAAAINGNISKGAQIIADKVLDDDNICDACKIKVLKILKEINND